MARDIEPNLVERMLHVILNDLSAAFDPPSPVTVRVDRLDTNPRCATIAHFGRFDQGIPMEGVEALIEKAHPTSQIFVYDANHGFNSDRRKDYHEPSSELARERTLALFKACGR